MQDCNLAFQTPHKFHIMFHHDNRSAGNGFADIGSPFRRSLSLGLVVMLLTAVISVWADLAFRKRFWGAAILFYFAIASLSVPSIVTSLGHRAGISCGG